MRSKVDTSKAETLTIDELRQEYVSYASQLGLECDVLMDGPINSRVVVVGEGPGESEVRAGIPFAGGSGKLLFDAIRQYGLHRANVYVTNVVKRQISLSRTGNERHIVHRGELQSWMGLLKWELERLPHVEVIFAMGNYAIEAITGNEGVMKWRGSVLDVQLDNGRNVKVVCTINPAYALRELKTEPMFLMDAKKLDLVNRGVFKMPVIDKIINPSYKEAMQFLRDLRKAKKPIAYDIEVINMETACHGVTNSTDHAMCINLRDGARNRYTVQEEADILLALQECCDTQQVIAQNGGFDAYWVWLHDRLKVHIGFDTLLAHHTLYPQFPHSLAFLTTQYTTLPYYKDEGKFWKEGGDIDQFWRYNCQDVAITLMVAERLKVELEKQGLTKFFTDHVMRARPHLTEATVHGVKVDMSLKAKITQDVGEDVAKSLAEFHRLVQELTGRDDYFPNPNSPQQLQTLLFQILGLKGRGQSTDETNRKHILKHPNTSPKAKEMLAALDRYKKEDKFLGTYAESQAGQDGRMRCDYKQQGVTNAPGRLSSSGLLDGQGMNLQNQPPKARQMFIADKGCVFIYFDLSQAEARVVAYRANIPVWKAQFEKARIDGKYDAHRALAADMFKIPYDKVPEKDTVKDADGNESYTLRYIAKRCRHGLNYRMQVDRLSEVTQLPFHEARKAFNLYHASTPELKRWWDRQEADFRKTRVIYNALGRRFKVIQRLDEDVLASIVAFYPQSTIGDKIVQVWYQAEEDDEWPTGKARVALNVHDNLVGIAEPKVAKKALSILKRYAESPLMIQDVYNHAPEPLIIPAECKMSVPGEDGVHRWSNLKTVEL